MFGILVELNMNQFIALTSFGIESLLADELLSLGAEDIIQKPEGIYFSAELATAYEICLKTLFFQWFYEHISKYIGFIMFSIRLFCEQCVCQNYVYQTDTHSRMRLSVKL